MEIGGSASLVQSVRSTFSGRFSVKKQGRHKKSYNWVDGGLEGVVGGEGGGKMWLCNVNKNF